MAKRVTGRVKSRRKQTPIWQKPKTLLALLIALLIGGGFWYLIANSKGGQPVVQKTAQMPAIQLPPTPEQKWAYREELEKRVVKNGVLNQQTKARLPEPAAQPTANTDSLQQFINQNVHSTTPTVSREQFGLQCGAFSQETGAERQKAMLVMLGVATRIVKTGGYYRVQTEPLGEKSQAYARLDALKGQVKCQVVAM